MYCLVDNDLMFIHMLLNASAGILTLRNAVVRNLLYLVSYIC